MNLTARACCAILLCLLAPAAAAGDFSLFAGAWDYGVGGDIDNQGNRISLDSDNGIRANTQMQVLLHYGFSRRWIPDLSAGYVHLGAAGSFLAPQSLQFGGIDIISGNTVVTTGININDFEASADWRVIDAPNLRLESGLALKYLNGHGTVIGNTTIGVIGIPVTTLVQQERFAVDQPVPLAHLHVTAIPWDRLRLEFSGAYIAYEGQHVGEMRAVADARVWHGLFITAGYQEQIYKVKEAPYTLHARIAGPTMGISIATP